MMGRMLPPLHYETDLCVGATANVMVLNLRHKPTPELIWRLADMIDQFIDSQADPIGIIVWLDADMPPPTAEVRRVIGSVMHSQASKVVGSLVVFEGSGLKEDKLRVTLAGVRHYGSLDAPATILKDIDEACLRMKQMLIEAGAWPKAGVELAALARAIKAHGRD